MRHTELECIAQPHAAHEVGSAPAKENLAMQAVQTSTCGTPSSDPCCTMRYMSGTAHPKQPDHTLRAKCNSIGNMSFCSTPPTLGSVCTALLGIPCYTQQTGQAVLPRAVLRTS